MRHAARARSALVERNNARAPANGVPLYSFALSYAIPARITSNSSRDNNRYSTGQCINIYFWQIVWKAEYISSSPSSYLFFTSYSLYQDRDTYWKPDTKLSLQFERSAFSAQIYGLIQRVSRSPGVLTSYFITRKIRRLVVRTVPFSPCYPLAPRGMDAGNYKALQRVLLMHRVQSARDSRK